MAWIRRRIFRLPSTPARMEREIDEELRFHLETRVAELIAAGRGLAEARAAAAREFGDLRASRLELRDLDWRRLRKQRRADARDVLRQDLRYAWRGLGRQPAFAAIVVVTLALAVGANSAVFSLIDPLLFRAPAGVRDAQSLRRLYLNRGGEESGAGAQRPGDRFSYPEYTAIRQATAGRAMVAAYIRRDSVPLVRGSDTTVAHVTYATADFLPLLGARLDLGRTFTNEEDRPQDPASVAVLTRAFAAKVFGANANPLGRTFAMTGRSFTVIGVVRRDFSGIDIAASDLWVPFSTSRSVNDPYATSWYRQGDSYIELVARLEDRESDAAFNAAASVADRTAWEADEPELKRATVRTGSIIAARGPAAQPQEVSISTRLAIVALIVLLVACANVANLLLLRASTRRREIAVRLALGVSRARLASQLLVETLLLASIAGVGAVSVAWWTGGALRSALMPRTHWAGSALTSRVFVFTAAITIVAGCLVALAPMMLARRRDVGAALAVGTRDAMLARSRTRGALLAVQVALSMVLVAGAGLFVRSLRKVEDIPLGVDASHLVVAFVQFTDHRAHPELGTAMPALAARFARMPGVLAAAYGSGAPFEAWMDGARLIPRSADSASSVLAAYNGVSPRYFVAAGTTLLEGRSFDDGDVLGAAPVMIVSQATAERLWPDQNPLGKCARMETTAAPCMRVVGVAEDAHEMSLTEDWTPQFYVPFAQTTGLPAWALTVRVAGADRSPPEFAPVVRNELRRAFPTAVVSVQPVSARIEQQLRPWRLGAQLFTALGLLSLVVAAIGLYGIIGFAVQQRTKELGIRVALGARGADIVRTVVRHSITPVFAGIACGALVTAAVARVLASLVYGISPRDPLTIGAAAVVLVVASTVASASPAWRAVRVDAVTALREE